LDEPTIVGLKDSSGDLNYLQVIRELARVRDDWSLLVGQEHLLARALELGADGGVCGGANAWPQLFVQIYEAAMAISDTAIAEQTDVLPHLVDRADRLARIYQLESGPVTTSSAIKGLKTALAALGICSNETAPPLARSSLAEQRQIEAILRELDFHPALVAQRA
jgi:4-hydroxy-tetrahydrodipicolinate synthase